MGNIHSGSNATTVLYSVIGSIAAVLLSTLIIAAADRIFDTGGNGVKMENRLTKIEDKLGQIDQRLDHMDRQTP